MEMSHDFFLLATDDHLILGVGIMERQLPPPHSFPQKVCIALLGAAREDQCLCYRLFLRWSQVKCA